MKLIVKHEIRGRIRIHICGGAMTIRQADLFAAYLGSLSMDEEDYEAAIPYFTAAIEGDCFTDFSSYNRGVCYLHTDQAKEAVSDFQYAVEHTTDPQLLSDSQNILDQITPKS